ncbi:MAG TPA: hypothetical protein VMW24_11835 [Sedimentisphaerales bacterium]|nr:hypothetical protein [Sedimentisphaerales bacterium]
MGILRKARERFEQDEIVSQFSGFTIIRQADVKSLAYFEAVKENR